MGVAVNTVSARSGLQLRLQGWPLFWVLAAPLLAVELRLLTVLDWSSADDIRWLMECTGGLPRLIFSSGSRPPHPVQAEQPSAVAPDEETLNPRPATLRTNGVQPRCRSR